MPNPKNSNPPKPCAKGDNPPEYSPQLMAEAKELMIRLQRCHIKIVEPTTVSIADTSVHRMVSMDEGVMIQTILRALEAAEAEIHKLRGVDTSSVHADFIEIYDAQGCNRFWITKDGLIRNGKVYLHSHVVVGQRFLYRPRDKDPNFSYDGIETMPVEKIVLIKEHLNDK